MDKEGELTFFAKGVKIAFFNYPFDINYGESIEFLPGFEVSEKEIKKTGGIQLGVERFLALLNRSRRISVFLVYGFCLLPSDEGRIEEGC